MESSLGGGLRGIGDGWLQLTSIMPKVSRTRRRGQNRELCISFFPLGGGSTCNVPRKAALNFDKTLKAIILFYLLGSKNVERRIWQRRARGVTIAQKV